MDQKKFIDRTIQELTQFKGKLIISALSGGIDSAVASVLVNKAVGTKSLKCVYVDTGLMRMQDKDEVISFAKQFDLNLDVIDAKKTFFSALKGIVDPEKKRKIIGKLFIKIFESKAKEFKAEYLVQGTIAPDWIESGVGRETIKSHHNVGGLPEKMGLKLIEPLRDLYKHEVRDVAKALGFPSYMQRRQPFPGPGLAVRIIGEVTEKRAELVRKATKIIEEEIERTIPAEKLPWQYFAAYLPVRTVGVKGDERAYNETILIRIVDSIDAMTANFSHIDHAVLQKISTRITNELPEVGRVLFDITNKPPATIEFE